MDKITLNLNVSDTEIDLEVNDNIYYVNGGTGGTTNLYEEAKKLISRFNHQYMNNQKYASENTVDIAIFAGQSNSCGRATLDDIKTEKDIIIPCPLTAGFSFNNTASTIPVQIVEPISANGSSAYGYIPAFINSYNKVTGRKICACYKSVGGVMLNKFAPYVLDNTTGEETTTVGTYYKNILDAVNHAKTNLVSNGYTVGDIFLVWCQGEADAAYLGNTNTYANQYEQSLNGETEIREYYKSKFSRLVEKLQEDVNLTTAFIIRIGESGSKPYRNTNIIKAQSELGKENPDCVIVSTIFAGAIEFIEEDGTVRNLMRDASHYVPEGYARAGLEAGVNAGIYQNSGKLVKPILLEYGVLHVDDTGFYERPVDKYIYDPCRVDFNFISSLVADTPVTSISLSSNGTEVAVGGSVQLSVAYTPSNATNKGVTYSVNNSNAKVSSSGVVTGLVAGESVITATLIDDPSITDSITITVIESSSGGDEGDDGTQTFEFIASPSSSTNADGKYYTENRKETIGKNLTIVSVEVAYSNGGNYDTLPSDQWTYDSSTGVITVNAYSTTNNGFWFKVTYTEGEEDIPVDDGYTTVVDFDFTENTIDDYALDGTFSVPEGSTTDDIEYSNTYGASLNSNLPNGLNLTNPVDASKPWILEFTATLPTPTVLAGNRKAFLGGNDLYPFVFINGNTYDNMGFQISNGAHKTVYGILAYDKEAVYKIEHDGSGTVNVYVDGTNKGTVACDFTGQTFTVILGNVKGKSSAYVWQNVESTKSYLHKFKFSYKA